MIKQLFIIILFLIIVSCQNHRLNGYENKILNFLIKNKELNRFELVLDTISSFEWDEMIVAGPYVYLERTSKEINYNFNRFSNTVIEDYDRFALIGFINKKKGVKYIIINHYLISDELFKHKNFGYRIYPRNKSNLLISKHRP